MLTSISIVVAALIGFLIVVSIMILFEKKWEHERKMKEMEIEHEDK